MNERTYRFGPLERVGFILGLRVPQLVGLAVFGALALWFLDLGGGLWGLFYAFLVVGVGMCVFVVSFRGHTLEQWIPVTVRFFVGRLFGRNRFRSEDHRGGHVVAVSGEADIDPREAGAAVSLPAELAELEFLVGVEGGPGVVKDRKGFTYTGVLRCHGEAFSLLSAQEQTHRLSQYGDVLAALARDNSPIRRVGWVERTLPADRDRHMDYLDEAMRDGVSLDNPPRDVLSYLKLSEASPDVAQDHELLFFVQLDSFRPAARKAIKRMGGGNDGAYQVLARELSQVADLLSSAGVKIEGWLSARGVAAAIRNAYDPWGRQQRLRSALRSEHADKGIDVAGFGPVARDENWGHIATDGAVHTTLWISEWPRIDVRALFLQPLLMRTEATRTVAMVMDIVGPGKAIRDVEKAATEADTNQALRDRVGQRTSQRDVQKEGATRRRESELAEGHAEVRFAGYVTVSARNLNGSAIDELEDAVSRVELEANRAPLRLERIWGQQADAFTYTLPLGRGLR